MSFTVTPDTIVKILVRRGLESERVNTVLGEGELGYSIDTRRLFAGDGVSLGGNVVGNKFLGFTGFAGDFTAFSQQGDFIVENNVLKVLDSGNNWTSLAPQYYTEPQNLNIPSIEYSTQNRVRVSPFNLGDGFSLTYSDVNTSNLDNTIQRKYGKVNFDANYLSLSADYKSFYFGNIFNKTVNNNLSATVNVENSLFVNSTEASPNPRQVRIYGTHPSYLNSVIESETGSFDIRGNDSLNLFANKNQKNISLFNNNTITISAKNTGVYNSPDINVYGNTQFRNKLFVTDDATVFGNLSVYGDLSYLETKVSTTSALSVVNVNSNIDTAVFIQRGSLSNQNILRVEGNNPTPFLLVRDGSGGGVVGINVRPSNTFTNFTVATYTQFYNGDFNVIPSTGTIRLSTSNFVNVRGDESVLIQGDVVDINPYSNLNINPGSGLVYLTGGIVATGDITAFAASDISLKTNIENISNALEKVKNLNGVLFDWNEKAEERYSKIGREAGVIAQEVEKVLPEIVTTREDGTKAVKYDCLIPLLIEAIKELAKSKSCACNK